MLVRIINDTVLGAIDFVEDNFIAVLILLIAFIIFSKIHKKNKREEARTRLINAVGENEYQLHKDGYDKLLVKLNYRLKPIVLGAYFRRYPEIIGAYIHRIFDVHNYYIISNRVALCVRESTLIDYCGAVAYIRLFGSEEKRTKEVDKCLEKNFRLYSKPNSFISAGICSKTIDLLKQNDYFVFTEEQIKLYTEKVEQLKEMLANKGVNNPTGVSIPGAKDWDGYLKDVQEYSRRPSSNQSDDSDGEVRRNSYQEEDNSYNNSYDNSYSSNSYEDNNDYGYGSSYSNNSSSYNDGYNGYSDYWHNNNGWSQGLSGDEDEDQWHWQ